MPTDSKTTAKEVKPKQIVSDVVEQRKASLRYFNENYYKEFAEIYRNINARAKPLRRYNEKSSSWEDDTDHTNVCVPDHFVMLRRGTARLTRNPPNLRVRGGPDTDENTTMREKTSAKLMFNWDRSESQRAFKKIVNVGYGLGWAMGKVYYDEVNVIRRLRKLTTSLAPKDFQNLAKSNDPEVAQMVQQLGPRIQDPTPFSPDEMSQIVATMGDQTSLNQATTRYKGPVLDNVFIGDIFGEPGYRSANESAWWIENSMRDEEWLEYWLSQTSIDPRTGQSSPVFNKEKCDKVLSMAGNRTYIDTQEMTLRRHMREAIEIADPITAGKPIKSPKKRFMVDERHAIVDGHLCIDFVGEESAYLGRLWYPWETYGRFQYCEMVMIPDWLGGIGMSTLRVTRFLHQLRNARMNQTTDFINNKLLPILKVREGADLTAYDVVRTGFARLLQVANMGDIEFQQDPTFPAEAWNDQASLQQQMQQADPSTIDFSPGTEDVSGAGKFATTARIADKNADSVTADTLDNMNMFIRDAVELALWMDQQAMNEPVDVPKEYFERIDAVSIRSAGANAKVIRVDWPDIQETLEILPEAGSTLASDDEFRVRGLQQFAAMGERHPDIVNMRAVFKKLAEATPGINAEDIILPEPKAAPPPPPKMTINLSIKWETLPPDVQAAFLAKEGLPVEGTHIQGVGDVIQHASDTADAAANLESPVDHSQPQGKPNGKPPARKANH
jgi:hypothetical protein